MSLYFGEEGKWNRACQFFAHKSMGVLVRAFWANDKMLGFTGVTNVLMYRWTFSKGKDPCMVILHCCCMVPWSIKSRSLSCRIRNTIFCLIFMTKFMSSLHFLLFQSVLPEKKKIGQGQYSLDPWIEYSFLWAASRKQRMHWFWSQGGVLTTNVLTYATNTTCCFCVCLTLSVWNVDNGSDPMWTFQTFKLLVFALHSFSGGFEALEKCRQIWNGFVIRDKLILCGMFINFCRFPYGLLTDTQRQNDEHESQLHIFSESIKEQPKHPRQASITLIFILINGQIAGV